MAPESLQVRVVRSNEHPTANRHMRRLWPGHVAGSVGLGITACSMAPQDAWRVSVVRSNEHPTAFRHMRRLWPGHFAASVGLGILNSGCGGMKSGRSSGVSGECGMASGTISGGVSSTAEHHRLRRGSMSGEQQPHVSSCCCMCAATAF